MRCSNHDHTLISKALRTPIALLSLLINIMYNVFFPKYLF